MRKLSEIKIGDKVVVVRELTVAQVERQFSEIKTQEEPTTLDWMFSSTYMPEAVLAEIIGEPVALLITEETTPTDLEPLYKEALKINPFLEKALEQMRQIATMVEEMDLLKKQSGFAKLPSA